MKYGMSHLLPNHATTIEMNGNAMLCFLQR